jgi:hypothetical protein
MGRRISRWAVTLAMAMFVAACTGAASSSAPPTPSAPPAPSASPSGPAASAYRLRATTTQAIPPINRFGVLPMVTITGDNQVVVAGPQIMIYPGPLLPNLQARPITDAGFAKIVERGQTLGMFSGSGNFVPPDVMPGASLGRIEIVVDGVLHDLTGDPSRVMVCVTTPCDPAPGTPEAFGAFWASLSDLTWLAGDLGQEAPYVAESYALLIGVEPVDDPAIRPAVAIWPLEQPIATLGKPVRSAPTPRCGTVRGADAATLRPSLESANQLTRWVDEGADRADATPLQVRPMVPGEDVCLEVFGLSE